MSGVLNLLLSSAAGVIRDAYFNLVTLLLNTTATNGAQNNTFLDSSTNNFSITRNGNTTQGTFTPFSQTGWSNNFGSGATSSTLTSASTSVVVLGSGQYTIEAWLYVPEYRGPFGLYFCTANAASGALGLFAGVNSNGTATLQENSGSVILNSTSVVPLNAWTHVAFVRDSSSTKVYINGVQDGTSSVNFTKNYTDGKVQVGSISATDASGFYFIGSVSNLRVVVGTAVYTSNFTPSTTPLTAIANTKLLTCQSNSFIDNSSQNIPLTVYNGTPSVQAFSPLAPTIEYDAAVVGGSGYFDGTGDYLTVGSGTDVDLGSSDFMIEAWYYCLQNGTYASGVFCKRVGGVASGWGMNTVGFVCDMNGTWYDSWGNPFWVGSTQNSGYNSSTSLQKLNQWTHIVVTRQGTDARWFVNGQLLGYFSRTGAIQQLTGSPLAVGLGGTTAEQPFIGYISNGRVIVGSVPTGYQTSSTTLNAQIFTPPTAPVSTTSQGATSGNVKYIGNFINAGITDSAAKNDLETVGNAQVSTTQAKWGTTSMYFAGSPNYLQLSNPNANVQLGSGNFTIEMWVNFSSAAGTQVLNNYGYEGGSTNYSYLFYYSSNTIRFGNSTDGSAGTSQDNSLGAFTPTAGTWYHLALVRNGTTVTCYVDGTALSAPYNIAARTIFFPGNASTFTLGANGGNYFSGYIDDFRLTKGYARYTANFTPPAAAFPLQ